MQFFKAFLTLNKLALTIQVNIVFVAISDVIRTISFISLQLFSNIII